jgi:ATP-dependent Clp protease ATP-binding subunit ClpA
MEDFKRLTSLQNLPELLSLKVVGQQKAIERIVPCIQMYQAGLSPLGRPAGVFLLLGPTGTGKTRTVEALAEVLHGDSHKVVRVDCGEYQSDRSPTHLSPPGYIGIARPRRLTIERLQVAKARSDSVLLTRPRSGSIRGEAVWESPTRRLQSG